MNNTKVVKKVPVESCQLLKKRDGEDGVSTILFLSPSLLIYFNVNPKYGTYTTTVTDLVKLGWTYYQDNNMKINENLNVN